MAPQPFVPLANGAQVEFVHTLFGEIVECRLWFICRFDPISPTLLLALAEGASLWWRTSVLPFLSQDLTLINTIATNWESTPAPYTSFDTTIASGGVAEGSYSANVSIRVVFKGDGTLIQRNNSNFVPGLPLSSVNGNYYTSTIKEDLFDAYVELIDLAGTWDAGNNWRWVVTSRRKDYIYRDEQLSAAAGLILFPSPVISPRRRRLPRP